MSTGITKTATSSAVSDNAIEVENLTKYYGSIPTRNPGEVQMPSALLRWGLLFISGVFIPLSEMGGVARAVAYLSPLTYTYDLMNHAVLGIGPLSPWLDLGMLLLSGVLFLVPSMWLHRRSRRLGY